MNDVERRNAQGKRASSLNRLYELLSSVFELVVNHSLSFAQEGVGTGTGSASAKPAAFAAAETTTTAAVVC